MNPEPRERSLQSDPSAGGSLPPLLRGEGDPHSLLSSFLRDLLREPDTGICLDFSKLGIPGRAFEEYRNPMVPVFLRMTELEAGAIANPDEGRRVGHYWLRAPELAPEGLDRPIRETVERVLDFAERVREGRVRPLRGGRFTTLCLCGIGGSALGPQLVSDALGGGTGALTFHSLDNTDPEGILRVLEGLGEEIASCLFLVVSKSGGTKETRNAMLEAQAFLEARGLRLPPQAVAVTGEGSALAERASSEGWLATFPMWDWVGGRTSVTSAVGLLPAALCGVDLRAFLDGAAAMDRATRLPDLDRNPAARLAVAWHLLGRGRGERAMVVLPYRDRLHLLSRHLQQLVMESLGKGRDLEGRPVQQGLSVYGNKGSTDQHAFVQQLRDGNDDFFVTFVRVLEEGSVSGLEVEDGATSGDFLHGFYLGTRAALSAKGRPNLTLSLPRLDARSLGAVIALFERTVGFYADLIGINAYDQPGVEAGKKAAGKALALRARILELCAREPSTLSSLLDRLGIEDEDEAEIVFLLCEQMLANPARSGLRLDDGGRLAAAGRGGREP